MADTKKQGFCQALVLGCCSVCFAVVKRYLPFELFSINRDVTCTYDEQKTQEKCRPRQNSCFI